MNFYIIGLWVKLYTYNIISTKYKLDHCGDSEISLSESIVYNRKKDIREAIFKYLTNEFSLIDLKIGGKGEIIECDESCVRSRKKNKNLKGSKFFKY